MTAIVVHVCFTRLTRNVEGDRARLGNKYQNASVSTGSLSRCSQPCSEDAYRALVDQQIALLFVRQRLCGVILQIGRKVLWSAHPQNSDGDALDAKRELERRFER